MRKDMQINDNVSFYFNCDILTRSKHFQHVIIDFRV